MAFRRAPPRRQHRNRRESFLEGPFMGDCVCFKGLKGAKGKGRTGARGDSAPVPHGIRPIVNREGRESQPQLGLLGEIPEAGGWSLTEGLSSFPDRPGSPRPRNKGQSLNQALTRIAPSPLRRVMLDMTGPRVPLA